MRIPHRGARARGLPILLLEKFAPGKRVGLEFVYGSCNCAADVVVRSGVAAWKVWAAIAQDSSDLWRGRAAVQQLLGDPFIGDAPVRLWEALENPQPVQPSVIDAAVAPGITRTALPVTIGRQSLSSATVEAAADSRTVASNPPYTRHMCLSPSKAPGASNRGFTRNV